MADTRTLKTSDSRSMFWRKTKEQPVRPKIWGMKIDLSEDVDLQVYGPWLDLRNPKQDLKCWVSVHEEKDGDSWSLARFMCTLPAADAVYDLGCGAVLTFSMVQGPYCEPMLALRKTVPVMDPRFKVEFESWRNKEPNFPFKTSQDSLSV
jgi:hypothetical protein